MKYLYPKVTRCSGLSLVELMIALTLGLIIIGSVISLFVASKVSYTQSEAFARIQENARFSMLTLESDLKLVKFFGEVSAVNISNDTHLGTVSSNCTGDAAAYDYNTPLAATTSSATTESSAGGVAYGCITDAVPNTGVLVIKHVRPQPLATGSVANNKSYILANHDTGRLYDGADTAPVGEVPNGRAWEYQAHVYYIRSGTVPTLSRKTLQILNGNMTIVTEDVVSGVEAMRLQFGLDSDTDGDLDTFMAASTINTSTTVDWNDVGAVRINLLIRSESSDPSFVDDKTYNLGDNSPVENPNDNFHRTVVSTTLALRNPQFVIRGAG
ncbi:MAG: PilW family protein [Sedimenticola sp.]